MQRACVFVFFLFITSWAQAQMADTIAIHKDPRLDLLVKKQVELNRQVYKENNRTGPGYRILVINTNDRKKAMDIKTQLMKSYPAHKTYLIYQSPYFKIQIGNFRERTEAEALRKDLMHIIGGNIIVVPSTVEYPQDAERIL